MEIRKRVGYLEASRYQHTHSNTIESKQRIQLSARLKRYTYRLYRSFHTDFTAYTKEVHHDANLI